MPRAEWTAWRDSNPRPAGSHRGAKRRQTHEVRPQGERSESTQLLYPTELQAQYVFGVNNRTRTDIYQIHGLGLCH